MAGSDRIRNTVSHCTSVQQAMTYRYCTSDQLTVIGTVLCASDQLSVLQTHTVHLTTADSVILYKRSADFPILYATGTSER